VALAAATLAGVLVIELVPSWLPYGLPISAGVALYVAATDLVPEVNREPGIRMALVFFAGVGGIPAAADAAAGALRAESVLQLGSPSRMA
jgi:zinc transporter ZupT